MEREQFVDISELLRTTKKKKCNCKLPTFLKDTLLILIPIVIVGAFIGLCFLL